MLFLTRIKKIKYKDLGELALQRRLTVGLFYSKGCAVCKKQERDIVPLKKKFSRDGVIFVKLNVLKGNVESELGIYSVPTIKIWVKGGVDVAYRFQPGGDLFTQINGRIGTAELSAAIEELLRQ